MLCQFITFGQNNKITSQFYSINDGLSDRLVADMIQGEDGFIWIGTPNGLNKFDGYEFITFDNTPGNTNRLSEIFIEKLFQDKAGNIVILYKNNLLFFDLLNPFTHECQKIGLLPENGIKGIVRQITVATSGEIIVLAIDNQSTIAYKYIGNNQFAPIFDIREDRRWFTASLNLIQLNNGDFLLNDSEKGLKLIAPNGKVKKVFIEGDFICLEKADNYPGNLSILHQDKLGRVWLAFTQNTGVFQYFPEQKEFRQVEILPAGSYFPKIWEDKLGNVLFNKVVRLEAFPNAEQLICIKADGTLTDLNYLLNPNSLIISIWSEDFFKTVLLGLDTGLKIIQNNRDKVINYLAEDLLAEQRGTILRGITGNQDKVYFNEESGLWYALDLRTWQLDTLELINTATGKKIDTSCSYDIEMDSLGFVWGISCYNSKEGRLHRYNPAKEQTTTYNYLHKFNAFTIGQNGLLWLVADTGTESMKGQLVSFNTATNEFDLYQNADGSNPLANATPLFIYQSRNGILWIGTDNGLIKIDLRKRKSASFRASAAQNTLKSNIIHVIHEDKDGNIWVGTNNGLSVLNPQIGIFNTYFKRDGLVSNTVCGILSDTVGNFWISTYNGISYFDKKNNQFHNFSQVDGFSHDEFNRFSYYRDQYNRYYFGGVNGLNIFDPQNLLIDEKIPTVVLTKLSKFNTRREEGIQQFNYLNDIKTLTISPYDIDIQLHFMLPWYVNPSRNQFSAFLEGYDKEWTYLGRIHQLVYKSLPPGRYTLHIKGADPNGNWSKDPLIIKIVVKRIFYKTWWFLTLFFATILFFAYVFLRYNWEQQLQVERFRTRVSSDLHDELSGLLSGIAMQTDMIRMMTTDETTQSRLKHIGEVSRKAMSKMSDVIWSIDSRKDKMENLIIRMREHADDILLPLNIQYTFQIHRIDYQQKIPPSIRQELYLIFKEAINNIAKHSNASQVDIAMGNQDGIFFMNVIDNGKNQKKNGSSIKKGQGLSNIRMRAARINGEVEFAEAEGFTVTFRMKKFAK